MKLKSILKIVIDITMIILFILLMSFFYMDNKIHEFLGIGLFIAFIIHTLLNYKWYLNIFKGKYNLIRIITLLINISLLIVMVLIFISSLFISLHIFKDINFNQALLGRKLHLTLTMWAFILVSLHLGLHTAYFLNMIKKKIVVNEILSSIIKWVLRVILVIIIIYSVSTIINNKIWEELFLLTEFKFYDYEKTLFISIIEYASIMIFFQSITYYLKKSIIFLKIRKHK